MSNGREKVQEIRKKMTKITNQAGWCFLHYIRLPLHHCGYENELCQTLHCLAMCQWMRWITILINVKTFFQQSFSKVITLVIYLKLIELLNVTAFFAANILFVHWIISTENWVEIRWRIFKIHSMEIVYPFNHKLMSLRFLLSFPLHSAQYNIASSIENFILESWL